MMEKACEFGGGDAGHPCIIYIRHGDDVSLAENNDSGGSDKSTNNNDKKNIGHSNAHSEKLSVPWARHDTPITYGGALRAQQTARYLMLKYGVPDIILCSPYLRTRQTAHFMKQQVLDDVQSLTSSSRFSIDSNNHELPALESDQKIAPVYVESLLSKYMKVPHESLADIRPDTRKYNPPLSEVRWQVYNRVRRHIHLLNEIDWRLSTVPLYQNTIHNADNINTTVPPQVIWCITHGIVLTSAAKLYNIPVPRRIPFCGYVCLHDVSYGVFETDIYKHDNIKQ